MANIELRDLLALLGEKVVENSVLQGQVIALQTELKKVQESAPSTPSTPDSAV